MVQDAVLRCQRIKSLIDVIRLLFKFIVFILLVLFYNNLDNLFHNLQIRNEIRYAVEVCSVLKMKR